MRKDNESMSLSIVQEMCFFLLLSLCDLAVTMDYDQIQSHANMYHDYASHNLYLE